VVVHGCVQACRRHGLELCVNIEPRD
jgi:hypothetical protein